MKHLQVVAAVIIKDGKILCVQRPQHKFDYLSFKYEFPGGKIEEKEGKVDALKREIFEELEIVITVDQQLIKVYHEYPDFLITMYAFLCYTDSSKINLKEHVDSKWLSKVELDTLDWAAADIPIVQKIKNTFNERLP